MTKGLGVFLAAQITIWSAGPFVASSLDQGEAALVEMLPLTPSDLSKLGLGSESTILLVLSPDCAVCAEGFPFFKQLLALPRMDGVHRRLVVISQNGVVPMRRVLDANSFVPHYLSSGPAAVDNLKEVPVLIVLDAKGSRLGTWTGKLTTSAQAEILAAINR